MLQKVKKKALLCLINQLYDVAETSKDWLKNFLMNISTRAHYNPRAPQTPRFGGRRSRCSPAGQRLGEQQLSSESRVNEHTLSRKQCAETSAGRRRVFQFVFYCCSSCRNQTSLVCVFSLEQQIKVTQQQWLQMSDLQVLLKPVFILG